MPTFRFYTAINKPSRIRIIYKLISKPMLIEFSFKKKEKKEKNPTTTQDSQVKTCLETPFDLWIYNTFNHAVILIRRNKGAKTSIFVLFIYIMFFTRWWTYINKSIFQSYPNLLNGFVMSITFRTDLRSFWSLTWLGKKKKKYWIT